MDKTDLVDLPQLGKSISWIYDVKMCWFIKQYIILHD